MIRKTGILNYFDERYTSAAVKGINNKVRMITKRCHGVKSPGTLWNGLILDLNRTSEAVGWSIAELRETVTALKAVFLAFSITRRTKNQYDYTLRLGVVLVVWVEAVRRARIVPTTLERASRFYRCNRNAHLAAISHPNG